MRHISRLKVIKDRNPLHLFVVQMNYYVINATNVTVVGATPTCPIWLNGQRTAANWKTATRASLRRCVQAPEARGRSALISVVHLGHNGTVPSSMTTDEKLDWIIETLKRMEARQVELKTGVDDVQAHEPVGSFASPDTGKKA